MKRVFGVVSLTIALFFLLALAFTAAGSLFDHPPALVAGFEACEMPCWGDIRIYHTTLEAAQQVLVSAGYRSEGSAGEVELAAADARLASGETTSCVVRMAHHLGSVIRVTLANCRNVHLGDLLLTLGAPDGVFPAGTALSFRDGLVVVTMRGSACLPRLSPYSEVLSIYVNPEKVTSSVSSSPGMVRVYPWHGFIGTNHYFRREPSMPRNC